MAPWGAIIHSSLQQPVSRKNCMALTKALCITITKTLIDSLDSEQKSLELRGLDGEFRYSAREVAFRALRNFWSDVMTSKQREWFNYDEDELRRAAGIHRVS